LYFVKFFLKRKVTHHSTVDENLMKCHSKFTQLAMNRLVFLSDGCLKPYCV